MSVSRPAIHLDITDLKHWRLLTSCCATRRRRAFVTAGSSFHPKAYIFAVTNDDQLVKGTAFIGSGATSAARPCKKVWRNQNTCVVYPGDPVFEARDRFEALRPYPIRPGWRMPGSKGYEQHGYRCRGPSRRQSEQEARRCPTPFSGGGADGASRRRGGVQEGPWFWQQVWGKTWLRVRCFRIGARRACLLHTGKRFDQPGVTAHLAAGEESGSQVAPATPRSSTARVGADDREVRHLGALLAAALRPRRGRRIPPCSGQQRTGDRYPLRPRSCLAWTGYARSCTDQSDIPSPAMTTSIFSCHLFAGIRSGLLAPFPLPRHPRRVGRLPGGSVAQWLFDHEALSNKLATLARARHAPRASGGSARSNARWRSAFRDSATPTPWRSSAQARWRNCAAVCWGSTGRAQALTVVTPARCRWCSWSTCSTEGVDPPSIDTG